MAQSLNGQNDSILMCFTSVSWHVRHRRPSTNFACGRYRKDAWLSVVILRNVLLAYIVRRENGNERRRSRSLFHIWTSLRLFPLNETHYADDLKPEIPRGFNGLDCGRAGRADIIHDDDASTLLAE